MCPVVFKLQKSLIVMKYTHSIRLSMLNPRKRPSRPPQLAERGVSCIVNKSDITFTSRHIYA